MMRCTDCGRLIENCVCSSFGGKFIDNSIQTEELRKYNLDLATVNQKLQTAYDDLREAIHVSVCDLLDALDLPKCARPYSQQEVITKDIIPAIAKIDEQARQEQRGKSALLVDYCMVNCDSFPENKVAASEEIESIRKFLTVLAKAIREG